MSSDNTGLARHNPHRTRLDGHSQPYSSCALKRQKNQAGAMKPQGMSILLTAVCLVAAVVNVAIFFGTLHKTFILEGPKKYSYLDSDRPIELPVGPIPTVEMTFQESSRFSLSDNESHASYETLFTNRVGTGFQHLGPYHFRFISGAYHSLHCVYNMQLAFDQPHHLEHPNHHFIHCLGYLRQIFLCNTDLTLEHGDFMRRNLTTDRVGETRRCRDWSTVASWVDENFREWAEYNGVHLDD